jgi:hypothetical protein
MNWYYKEKEKIQKYLKFAPAGLKLLLNYSEQQQWFFKIVADHFIIFNMKRFIIQVASCFKMISFASYWLRHSFVKTDCIKPIGLCDFIALSQWNLEKNNPFLDLEVDPKMGWALLETSHIFQ